LHITFALTANMKQSLVLLLLLLILTPLVFCDGGSPGGNDGGGDPDDPRNDLNRENDERELQVDNKGNEIEIETRSKTNGAEDRFRFRLTQNDDGGLSARVESESQDANVQNRQQLNVFFSKLVSYSGGGFYSGGANTVGNGYNLVNANWAPFACNSGTPKWVCTAATKDNVFAATFEFSGTAFQANNVTITPSDLKITITINYPFGNTSASTDRVALQVFGTAKVAYKTTPDNAQRYKLVNTGVTAFTWIDNAVADNVNVTVGTSAVQFAQDGDDNRFGVWFSFDANQPAHIVWDPTVSTNNIILAGTSSSLVINLILLLALALFML